MNNEFNQASTDMQQGSQMPMPPKRNPLPLILLIIILIGAGVGAGYYFGSKSDGSSSSDTTKVDDKKSSNNTDDKKTDDNDEDKESNDKEPDNKESDNNDKKINENKNNDSKETKKDVSVNISDYKFVRDESNNIAYLTKKNGNVYDVVYTFKNEETYIGFYDNKFYYSLTNINYLDLTSETLTEKTWIEIPQPKCGKNESYCPGNSISKAEIVGGTMYFSPTSQICNEPENGFYGLMAFSMSATKYDDIKKIAPYTELDEWHLDENKENIYYAVGCTGENGIFKYNISTGKKEKLFEISIYANHIQYVKNNIVYYDYDKDELKLYDLSKKSVITLSKNLTSITRRNGSLHGLSDVYGNNLYYYDGNKTIVKYNLDDGSKANYYEIPDVNFYRAFDVYDDNNIEVIYDCYKGNYKDPTCKKDKDFVSNGKVVTEIPGINVKLTNGSTKHFTVNNIK